MHDHVAILVADDDEEDHLILMDYFDSFGFQQGVLFVPNGKKVLEYLEKTSDEYLPLLIILDLNMPILNGTQTLQYLKNSARLGQIPVLIYSTSDNDNERRKSLRYGAIDYLVKPHSYEEGKAMIDKIIQFVQSENPKSSNEG